MYEETKSTRYGELQNSEIQDEWLELNFGGNMDPLKDLEAGSKRTYLPHQVPALDCGLYSWIRGKRKVISSKV